MRELVLGGARSGKSAFAEQRALALGLDTFYIATAQVKDSEMAARIAAHRARRPMAWRLVEEPMNLAQALQEHAKIDRCIIVDCLTLWLSNLLHRDIDAAVEVSSATTPTFDRERSALVSTLPKLPGEIILVSNEVGMGIVPLGALTRRYCDEAGRLHQELARLCERVSFVAAGIPLTLKGT
ncbi:MAG: bifunctional adenosylcobinamide kinase/adenosylcobinamide-phosphate guanylyltransferase [Gammaproteobacteria bacterium]